MEKMKKGAIMPEGFIWWLVAILGLVVAFLFIGLLASYFFGYGDWIKDLLRF